MKEIMFTSEGHSWKEAIGKPRTDGKIILRS
jgi:hypothetical protein